MSPPSLALLRERYLTRGETMPRSVADALAKDPRRGALALLEAVERRKRARRKESRRLSRLLRYERELWDGGAIRIAGVDEAGMSPLAGPVAAAAVILDPNWRSDGIDDSKRLSPQARERLEVIIKAEAVAWSVAFVQPVEIDKLNIYWAGIAAMERAVAGLEAGPDHLLVDARRLEAPGIPCTAIIKGDQKSLSIAAASILAKTARDRLMSDLDRQYPGYGFARHKGYPVTSHREALQRLGPCAVHRRSFALVREAVAGTSLELFAEPRGGPPVARQPRA